jgi:hypothetical protein
MDSMEVVITVWVSKSLLPGELSRADLFLGAVFSISLCKDFINQSCPFLIPRWLQGKGLRTRNTYKNGGRDAKLFSCF